MSTNSSIITNAKGLKIKHWDDAVKASDKNKKNSKKEQRNSIIETKDNMPDHLL